jgi:hypothetical protein
MLLLAPGLGLMRCLLVFLGVCLRQDQKEIWKRKRDYENRPQFSHENFFRS